MNLIDTRLLFQVLQNHTSARSMKLMSGFMVLAAAGILFATYHSSKPEIGKLMFLLLICALGYLWCGAFLKSAIQQNLPSNAVLVPGLRVALMRLTAVLFAGCTLASAALGWLLIGLPGYVLVAGAGLAVFILFANRYVGLNLLPSVLVLANMGLGSQPWELLESAATFVGEPLLVSLGGIVLLLLGAKGVQVCFPKGGDAHWAWQRCIGRRRAAKQGQLNNVEPAAGIRWLAWMREPYYATLRADSRKGANQGRQLVHTLGPAAHDGNAMLSLLLTCAAMVALAQWLSWSKAPIVQHIWGITMQCVLMVSTLSYANAVALSAQRYVKEQALYRLTPGAPPTGQFNRVLMRTLLTRCLRLWLFGSLGVVTIDFVISGKFQLQGSAYLLSMLMLPFTALVLRDYASMKTQSGSWYTVFLPGLVMFVYVMLIAITRHLPEGLLFSLGSVIGLASLISLRWRWQRIMTRPPVLPAGRLVL
ncbi:hypothetical protein GJ699_12490 [Duganella sp. FT80W]|uniref:Uncharacterized protein n=1 Tax=Duganella guangzhouensis TaxID=2666084 RepID=A0A6I2L3J0_9BURK|nr:hypothetical protein [Duganella guangzhouensis]MRW90809.1 hypothetical protein [Duganella guangzhouensis]